MQVPVHVTVLMATVGQAVKVSALLMSGKPPVAL